MSSGALGKTGGARRPFQLDNSDAITPFPIERLAHGQALLQVDRAPVGAHAGLWKSRYVLRHFFGGFSRFATQHDFLAEVDAQALLGVDFAPRHDDLERPAEPHNPRQMYRAAIDQRNTPSPAIDAHVGTLRHDPAIGPEGQLHSAGNRRAFDHGNDRLRKFQARGGAE